MSKGPEFMRDLSDVTVTFHDGEVKTYRITANPTIGGYLAQQAGATGILSLFNDAQSYAIPMANIREWEICAVTIAQYEAETGVTK